MNPNKIMLIAILQALIGKVTEVMGFKIEALTDQELNGADLSKLAFEIMSDSVEESEASYQEFILTHQIVDENDEDDYDMPNLLEFKRGSNDEGSGGLQ